MPQYERKTGYVVQVINSWGWIAPEFDLHHPEQYFFHFKRVRGLARLHIGAHVGYFVELPKESDPDKRPRAFDIELLTSRPKEAA